MSKEEKTELLFCYMDLSSLFTELQELKTDNTLVLYEISKKIITLISSENLQKLNESFFHHIENELTNLILECMPLQTLSYTEYLIQLIALILHQLKKNIKN